MPLLEKLLWIHLGLLLVTTVIVTVRAALRHHDVEAHEERAAKERQRRAEVREALLENAKDLDV